MLDDNFTHLSPIYKNKKQNFWDLSCFSSVFFFALLFAGFIELIQRLWNVKRGLAWTKIDMSQLRGVFCHFVAQKTILPQRSPNDIEVANATPLACLILKIHKVNTNKQWTQTIIFNLHLRKLIHLSRHKLCTDIYSCASNTREVRRFSGSFYG